MDICGQVLQRHLTALNEKKPRRRRKCRHAGGRGMQSGRSPPRRGHLTPRRGSAASSGGAPGGGRRSLPLPHPRRRGRTPRRTARRALGGPLPPSWIGMDGGCMGMGMGGKDWRCGGGVSSLPLPAGGAGRGRGGEGGSAKAREAVAKKCRGVVRNEGGPSPSQRIVQQKAGESQHGLCRGAVLVQ